MDIQLKPKNHHLKTRNPKRTLHPIDKDILINLVKTN